MTNPINVGNEYPLYGNYKIKITDANNNGTNEIHLFDGDTDVGEVAGINGLFYNDQAKDSKITVNIAQKYNESRNVLETESIVITPSKKEKEVPQGFYEFLDEIDNTNKKATDDNPFLIECLLDPNKKTDDLTFRAGKVTKEGLPYDPQTDPNNPDKYIVEKCGGSLSFNIKNTATKDEK